MIGQEIYGLDGCSSPSGQKRKRNFRAAVACRKQNEDTGRKERND